MKPNTCQKPLLSVMAVRSLANSDNSGKRILNAKPNNFMNFEKFFCFMKTNSKIKAFVNRKLFPSSESIPMMRCKPFPVQKHYFE